MCPTPPGRRERAAVDGKDSGYEAFAIFAGPNARPNAIDYGRQLFGEFSEITPETY